MALTGDCFIRRLLRCPRSVAFYTLVFVLQIWLTSIDNVGQALAIPIYEHSKVAGHEIHDGSKSSVEAASFSETTLVAVGIMVSLVLCLVFCTGGCCLNIFGKRQHDDVQTIGFSNPIAELGNTSNTLSPIDVRALEMRQIEFEPLPQLQDLAPVSSYSYNSYCRGDFASRSLGVDSPCAYVATDDGSIYAHDWFEEPYHNFPRTHIEYVKEVGKGWFGQVIESQAEDIVPYAKKLRVLIKVLREDASGPEQMRFLDESRLFRESNHGNILKLLGHCIEKLPFLLVMEYCPQGDLKSFLIANVSRAELLNSQGVLLRMALDIAKGLEWMTSAGFIHKDLAARNCQVGSEGRIIIGDYGLSVQNFRDDYYWGSNVAIPLRWSAPETLHCTINTIQTLKVLKSSNVWTYGVVMWEIFEFGKLPYSELSDDDIILRVIIDRNYTLGQISRPGFALKDDLYRIMLSCWNPQHELRPCISEVVELLDKLFSVKLNDKLDSQNIMEQHSPGLISKDDFDRKWDESAQKVNAAPACEEATEVNWHTNHLPDMNLNNNQVTARKKKIVSFVGFEDEIPSVQVNTKVSTVKNDECSPNSNSGKDVNTVSSQCTPSLVSFHALTLNGCSDLSAQNSLLSSDSKDSRISSDKKAILDPEEDTWRKQIELGKISQKVRDKSQNVQNLMILTHVEPSDFSDVESLSVATNSGQGTQHSSIGTVSTLGSDMSRVVGTTVQASSSDSTFDNTPSIECLVTTSKQISVGSLGNSCTGVSVSNEQMSKSLVEESSQEYNNGDTSSFCNSVTSFSNSGSPIVNSASHDSTVLFFSIKPISESHVDRYDSSKKPLTPESNVATSSRRSYPSKMNETSHDNSVRKLLSSKKIVETSPESILGTLKNMGSSNERLCSSTDSVTLSEPRANTAGGTVTHNVFPTSQQALNASSSCVKGSGTGLEPRSRKAHKNFRSKKTSALNFSPTMDDTAVSHNCSFFRRNDDVFEDFSMEINGAIKPISKTSATPLYSITAGCNGDSNSKYGPRLSNVLLGPSEDLGLNLYQRVTTELVSEPSSAGVSDSQDFFDGFKDSQQSVKSLNTDEIGADQLKSGFQDVFGREISSRSTFESRIQIPATNKSVSSAAHVARKLDFESEAQKYATDPSGKSTEASDNMVTPAPTVEVDEFHTVAHLSGTTKDEISDISSPGCLETSVENTQSSRKQLGADRICNTGIFLPDFLVDQQEENETFKFSSINPVEERDKFVEDIEAVADEIGSLVMIDFEEEAPGITVIKETREDDNTPREFEQLEGRSLKSTINAFDNTDMLSISNNSLNTEVDHGDGLGVCDQLELKFLSKSESEATTENSVFPVNNVDVDGKDSENEEDGTFCQDFVPSKWNQNLIPAKPSIKSPEQKKYDQEQGQELDLRVVENSTMKKSVSFERKKVQLVYEYPPPLPPSDSEDEEKLSRPLGSSILPFNSALDWELQPEELENADVLLDDSEDEVIQPKSGNPMDVYRISTDLDNFHVRASTEPFLYSSLDQMIQVEDFPLIAHSSSNMTSPTCSSMAGTSTLGELRHTRNKLKLDLSKGEASILDSGNTGDLSRQSVVKLQQVDSGVGSSTNVSPFNTCDNQS